MTYATTTLSNTRTSAGLGLWLKGLLIVGLLVAQAACETPSFCETRLEARTMCGSDKIPTPSEQARCLATEELYGNAHCERALADLYLCQITHAACVEDELTLYCAKEQVVCMEDCFSGSCNVQ